MNKKIFYLETIGVILLVFSSLMTDGDKINFYSLEYSIIHLTLSLITATLAYKCYKEENILCGINFSLLALLFLPLVEKNFSTDNWLYFYRATAIFLIVDVTYRSESSRIHEIYCKISALPLIKKIQSLFTFKGKLNRLEFFYRSLTMLIPLVAFFVVKTYMSTRYYISRNITEEILLLLVLAVWIIWFIYGFSIVVRRLRDLSWTGYVSLTLFLPVLFESEKLLVLNLLFSFYLLFKSGKQEEKP